jgi:small subunit ribosomal protein S14
MARNALKVKQAKLEHKMFDALAQGKVMDKATRFYNRCKLCGRRASFIRDFGVCRVCLRKYAREGLITGLKKSSR